MTKQIIALTPAGGIYRYNPNMALVAAMTGDGGVIREDVIEVQIARRVGDGADSATARKFVGAIAKGGITEAEAIALIAALDLPADATDWELRDSSELPTTEVFRNSFERPIKGGPIMVNMPKARLTVTDQIRVERDLRLTSEDIAYMRADEQNDDAEKQRIAAKKQELRDMPATIQPELNMITTPEALETWQPTWPI